MLKISISALKQFFKCPRGFFFGKHPAVPKKTDYPRLAGGQVHKHLDLLYKPTKDGRPFFYKTKKSAIGAWFSRWERALKENASKLNVIDDEIAEKYKLVGIGCIAKYWDDNVSLPRPFQTEERYGYKIMPGIELIGIYDQVRRVSLDYVARHRPELIVDGKLREDYDNVVIVDLKTDYSSYDMTVFKQDANLYEKIRHQYELHEDIQATMYTFLYEKATGKKPIGFVWYHLRSGKTFFTYREERHYRNLYGLVNHFLLSLNHDSFPKIVGPNCKRCDYIEPCNEDNPFLFVEPDHFIGESLLPELAPSNVVKEPGKQMKLKLKIKSQKIPKSMLGKRELTESDLVVLNELPWDDESLTGGGD